MGAYLHLIGLSKSSPSNLLWSYWLAGWWFQPFNPSEKYKSMGRIIPYIMEKINVPNHQPVGILEYLINTPMDTVRAILSLESSLYYKNLETNHRSSTSCGMQADPEPCKMSHGNSGSSYGTRDLGCTSIHCHYWRENNGKIWSTIKFEFSYKPKWIFKLQNSWTIHEYPVKHCGELSTSMTTFLASRACLPEGIKHCAIFPSQTFL